MNILKYDKYETWLINSLPVIYANLILQEDDNYHSSYFTELKERFIQTNIDIFHELRHLLYKNIVIIKKLKFIFMYLYESCSDYDSLIEIDIDLFYNLSDKDIKYLYNIWSLASKINKNILDELSNLSIEEDKDVNELTFMLTTF
jgi:hypothetical protein